LGWQFDVTPAQGLTFGAPVVAVDGLVRASLISAEGDPRGTAFALPYCAADTAAVEASLTFRQRLEDAGDALPREAWRFERGGCAIAIARPTRVGVYEAVYRASGSPVAGLGLAAVRDFASYLKHGGRVSTLRESPGSLARVIGFGYSQSGRFLREFVRDGFNTDERGRSAFDGLLIASAGAGGGSFNHRFAMPGQAGNSVLSILRPVDVPPFTDEGLLARARSSRSVPRIFYTFSSTEYWARAGSLTHTTEDGTQDVPLADTSRLYLLTGSPHAAGPIPPIRETTGGEFRHALNFAQQRWSLRALLIAMDEWLASATPPPASRYPSLARGELVARESVRFPAMPSMALPPYMPGVWRLDFGPLFASAGIIAEPPRLGRAYTVLVPQVDLDGNDRGGVPQIEVAVPLGTHTGWNVTVPALDELRYLSGLTGSFEPFARTREGRERTGDSRRSVDERYANRAEYLARVGDAARALVRDRLMLAEDVAAATARADATWTALIEGSPPR
ncbi:MAG TPA: alpha/beta hydrolase domain-containing protein, partial [Vicinamibacterales bacterium]